MNPHTLEWFAMCLIDLGWNPSTDAQWEKLGVFLAAIRHQVEYAKQKDQP